MNPPASADAHPWCVVAASRALAPGSVVPIVLDGQALALWRAESGSAHVWTDRCPHRGMRLSLGAVAPRGLICPYHGWRFGEDRHCNFIPAHPQTPPPRAAAPQAHGVQERHGYIWVHLQAGSENTCLSLPDLPATLDPIRSLQVQADLQQAAQAFASLCVDPVVPGPQATPTLLRGRWPDGTDAGAEVVALLQPASPGHGVLHLASVQALPLARRLVLNQRLVALRNGLQAALPQAA